MAVMLITLLWLVATNVTHGLQKHRRNPIYLAPLAIEYHRK